MPKPAKRYAPAKDAARALRQLADDLEERGGEMRWYTTINFNPAGEGAIRTLSLGFKFPGEEDARPAGSAGDAG